MTTWSNRPRTVRSIFSTCLSALAANTSTREGWRATGRRLGRGGGLGCGLAVEGGPVAGSMVVAVDTKSHGWCLGVWRGLGPGLTTLPPHWAKWRHTPRMEWRKSLHPPGQIAAPPGANRCTPRGESLHPLGRTAPLLTGLGKSETTGRTWKNAILLLFRLVFPSPRPKAEFRRPVWHGACISFLALRVVSAPQSRQRG
jgi:hypothetical protein